MAYLQGVGLRYNHMRLESLGETWRTTEFSYWQMT
jgi:hypothetical protein